MDDMPNATEIAVTLATQLAEERLLAILIKAQNDGKTLDEAIKQVELVIKK